MGRDLGINHLGFITPFWVVWMHGERFRTPGTGRCSECEERRDRVYLLGDGRPYCDRCIEFDIAEANPSDEMKREQRHPPQFPIETIYEKVKYAVSDGADLRVYEKAFA